MSEMYVQAQHPTSGRTGIVAAEGESLWLYLTAPDTPAVAADCWLLNREPAPTRDVLRAQAARYRAQGGPPPAPVEVLHPEAARGTPVWPPVRLRWNATGTAVAAVAGATVLGVVTADEPRGYSHGVATAGPWGLPLTPDVLAALFDAALDSLEG